MHVFFRSLRNGGKAFVVLGELLAPGFAICGKKLIMKPDPKSLILILPTLKMMIIIILNNKSKHNND